MDEKRPSRKSRLSCFGPVLGMALGFALGWFLHIRLGNTGLVDIATRLITLVFAALGWFVGTAFIRNQKLQCGGTEPLPRTDSQTRTRYVFSLLLYVALLLVAVNLLSGGGRTEIAFSFVVIFFILIGIAGEIGWGAPWKPLYVLFGIKEEP